MERIVSDNQFLNLLNQCCPATTNQFLNLHQDHIRRVYPSAVVAMDMFRFGEMNLTPTLEFVRQVVNRHIMQAELSQDQLASKPVQMKVPRKPGTSGHGKYSIRFFIQEVSERTGKAQKVLWTDERGHNTFLVNRYQDAEKMIDLKQIDRADSLYAEVEQKLTSDRSIVTIINRTESIGRMLGKEARR